MLSNRAADIYQRFTAVPEDLVPGVRLVFVMAGPACFPEDDIMRETVDRCHSLNIEALIVETGHKQLLVVGCEFEDVFAVLECPPDASPAFVTREVIRVMAGMSEMSRATGFLPVDSVRIQLLSRERRIARVFGKRFASHVIERACDGMHPGEMTERDLEIVKNRISSAISDSLEFGQS